MMILSRHLRRFSRDRRGTAAMEFVLLLPIMLTMSFGLAEVYVEHATEDQFLRYVHQSGDLLARETTLQSSDITAMHSASGQMVKGFDPNLTIEIHVASIGYREDGTPTLLWTRAAGAPTPKTPNVDEVAAMGLPTDTVIRFEAKISYVSPFKFIWNSTNRSVTSVAFFRPRETRAISMDGAVSEYDADWDYISTGGG
jgi:Flp pilus assembly protein TadG